MRTCAGRWGYSMAGLAAVHVNPSTRMNTITIRPPETESLASYE